MNLNAILPFVSAAVMIVFVIFVFNRFFSKKNKAWHLFLWGVGLLFYLLGSLMEAIHAALGWNEWVFRLWYLFGAVLVAAWLGQGTIHLLVRGKAFKKVKWANLLLAVLIIGSIYATYKVFTAQLEPIMITEEVVSVETESGYDEETVLAAAASALYGTAVDEDGEESSRIAPLAKAVVEEARSEGLEPVAPASLTEGTMPQLEAEVDGQVITLSGQDDTTLLVNIDGQPAGSITTRIGKEMHGHAIVSGGTRVLTPFFNMYGLIWLVGGAIYSAYLFLRKGIMPNRVLGNVLIAAGALMPGIGGLLSRFGMGGYLYVGELLGAILMFAGFIAATNRPETAGVKQPEAVPTK